MLGPGQTTDVLITTDQPARRYYMAAHAYASAPPIVAFDNTTTTAILEYKSVPCPSTKAYSKSKSKCDHRPIFPFLLPTMILSNRAIALDPFFHFLPAYNDTFESPQPSLQALEAPPMLLPKSPADVDVSLFFTVGLGLNPRRRAVLVKAQMEPTSLLA
ncbi:hypothetical protein IFM89_016285 [Coptis chinensis]|uniref:Plastocyanin-like domain-containing protein n=1 Tax=Coptis chinensis TaxID=261450 RepID=A0A835HN52_9MAGN|nr:hypothetical protein IFM89_016285 [Coptis chinensis]